MWQYYPEGKKYVSDLLLLEEIKFMQDEPPHFLPEVGAGNG